MFASLILSIALSAQTDQIDELLNQQLVANERSKLLQTLVSVKQLEEELNNNTFSLIRVLQYGDQWRAVFEVGTRTVTLEVGDFLSDRLRLKAVTFEHVEVLDTSTGAVEALYFGPATSE